jgi:hypothetical protein
LAVATQSACSSHSELNSSVSSKNTFSPRRGDVSLSPLILSIILFVRFSSSLHGSSHGRRPLTRSPRFRLAPQQHRGIFRVVTGSDRQHSPTMASHSSPPEPSATATEPAVLPSSTAESVPATPADDEKHNPTSPVDDEKQHSTDGRPSLHHHASSQIPAEAPALGAVGFDLEDEEKADAAATAFKHVHSSSPAPHEHGPGQEKNGPHLVEENGVAAPATGTTTDTEETQVGSEADAEEEVVFPGNTQLALLTFGLCVATFTVALGE